MSHHTVPEACRVQEVLRSSKETHIFEGVTYSPAQIDETLRKIIHRWCKERMKSLIRQSSELLVEGNKVRDIPTVCLVQILVLPPFLLDTLSLNELCKRIKKIVVYYTSKSRGKESI